MFHVPCVSCIMVVGILASYSRGPKLNSRPGHCLSPMFSFQPFRQMSKALLHSVPRPLPSTSLTVHYLLIHLSNGLSNGKRR
jgi:hypothetical protein